MTGLEITTVARPRRVDLRRHLGAIGPLAALAALLLIGLALNRTFLSPENVSNVLTRSAIVGIVAVGATFVITAGGLDLSVGAIFSRAGMVAGRALGAGWSWPAATLAGLALGAAGGLANGLLVTFVGLAPFVVTLVTYAVAGSLAFVITDGHSIAILDPDFWTLNGGALVPGVVNYLLFCLVGVVGLEWGLRKLVLGRWIYAVGSNDRAARLLGIPVRGARCGVYVASGALAAFSSMLSLSYISNAEATSGGNMMLQAIAACVIGGASLFGGTGSAVGAMLGAVMITVIQNGVNLIGVNSFWQGSVTGLVILVAVLIDRVTKARA